MRISHILFTVFLILVCSNLKGQVIPDTIAAQIDTLSTQLDTLQIQIDSLPDKIQSIETILKEIKNKINEDKDTMDIVGTIKMEKKVRLYSDLYKGKCEYKDENKNVIMDTVSFVHITKIELFISDGMIKNLRVYTKENKIFENTIFISIPLFRQHRSDYIGNIDFKKPCEFLILGEFLDYLHVTGNNYAPSDAFITIDTLKNNKDLIIKAGLNSYIEFRTYTDFFALIENEENGLVQAEARAKIIGNTKNWIPNRNIIFFSYVEPSLRFSKFDNDFATYKIDSSSIFRDTTTLGLDTLLVNRTELNQLSKFDIALRLNIFKAYFKLGSHVEFSLFGQFHYTDIQVLEEEKQTANLFTVGGDLGATLPRYRNFGLDANCLFFGQKITKKTGFDNEKYQEIRNDNFKMYLIPQFELYYFPLNNENNRIYLRFSIFNGFNENEKNFNQLQVGYKARINLK